jgi:hypothetical protein
MNDLCHVCVDQKWVMLSLESIKQQLENPKACCVFCEFFCKAAVGEVHWKECMDSIEECIGNDTTEAFALPLLFANNCKAWLHDQKLKHCAALKNEHDCDSNGKDSIVLDRLLVDQECVWEENKEEMLVVCDTTKLTHKRAANKKGLAC